MKIRIDGGVVVGWSGTGHEIIPDGSVLIENDTIRSVGTDKSQAGRQGDRRFREDCFSRVRQPSRSFAIERRRLFARRCDQEGLPNRQLVCLRRSFKGKTYAAAGAGSGNRPKIRAV